MEEGSSKQTKYDELIAEINRGGFFTGGVEDKDGSWRKKRKKREKRGHSTFSEK
jgi:hypothetical protein